MLTLLLGVVLGLAVALAALWWWLCEPPQGDELYRIELERRLGERRIDAIVDTGIWRLLDEARRHAVNTEPHRSESRTLAAQPRANGHPRPYTPQTDPTDAVDARRWK